MSFKQFAVPCATLVLLLTCFSPAMSSTSGKVAGIVTDAKTGEPLVGATVKVVGIQIAAETDADGEFYIINLPVGEYSLSVTMMGYEPLILSNVRVLTDLTTPLDFLLTSNPIQINKPVTVVAQRPLIQKDKVSSGAIVTRGDISTMAASRNIYGILASLNGTVMDADSGLHVRGGRKGSVTFYFDGFSIQDPFDGSLGMRIVPEALEEVSLNSGGIEPEYGEALSGVINAVTREGRDYFRGRVKAYNGYTHRYDVATGEYGGMEQTDNRTVIMDLSGPLASIGDRPVTFFAAGEILKNNGYLPHSDLQLYSGTGKIALFPTPQTKLVFNGSYNFRERQRYEHRDQNNISYDFNLDGAGKSEMRAYLLGVTGNYNKSANTVISVSLNRFQTKSKQAPEQLFDKHWSQWPGYSVDSNGTYNGTIDDSNYNTSADYSFIGFTSGNDFYPYYLERKASYTGGQFSFQSQADKVNQIKFGAELRRYELFWDNRAFYNVLPYGETYEYHPAWGAAYVRDKMEFNDLILNFGLRFDYQHSDVSYWHNPITKDYKKDAAPKVQWSPRFGISHPVSEHSVLYFNYGYLFQRPSYRLMYENLDGDLNTGYPRFGNPDLEPEKTIYYELGWTQAFIDAFRLNINTFYRDITNLVGSRDVLDDVGNVFTVFTNADYGEVKGVDFTLESIGKNLLNWSVSYSYMIAKGNASDPYEGYYDYATIEGDERPAWPVHAYPLSYDQRHKLTTFIDFRVPKGERLKVFGMTMPDAWGVNLEAQYGSGMAFTRTDVTGHRLGTLNGERMPYTMLINLRTDKSFHFFKGSRSFFGVFLEIENLFNRRNVINVYEATGMPDRDGNFALNVNSPNYQQEKLWYDLLAKDPQNYDHPRQVRVGMEFNF